MCLKHFLEAMTGKPGKDHDLLKLWQQCEMQIKPLDLKAWNGFAKRQRQFVDVMHSVDPTSTAFRYPAAKDGTPTSRPANIDLDALNAAAAAFENEIDGYIDWWWELQNAGP